MAWSSSWHDHHHGMVIITERVFLGVQTSHRLHRFLLITIVYAVPEAPFSSEAPLITVQTPACSLSSHEVHFGARLPSCHHSRAKPSLAKVAHRFLLLSSSKPDWGKGDKEISEPGGEKKAGRKNERIRGSTDEGREKRLCPTFRHNRGVFSRFPHEIILRMDAHNPDFTL